MEKEESYDTLYFLFECNSLSSVIRGVDKGDLVATGTSKKGVYGGAEVCWDGIKIAWILGWKLTLGEEFRMLETWKV